MKKIILLICGFFMNFVLIFSLESDYKIIYSDNTSLGRININKASDIEMLKAGVSPSYVEKIIEFRNIKGGIESLEELDRINGIGKKTCKRLEKYFFIEKDYNIKPLEINRADEKVLIYYGFSKEEIKKLNSLKKKNGRIKNNLDIKKIISKQKYEKYKDLFRYNMF